MSIFHFLLSDEADKCDNGEAAADQALPSLCHWLQVRSFDFSRQKQGEKLTVYTSSQCSDIFLLLGCFRFICDNLALPVPCHWERINTDEPYQVQLYYQEYYY